MELLSDLLINLFLIEAAFGDASGLGNIVD